MTPYVHDYATNTRAPVNREPALREAVEELRVVTREHGVTLPSVEDFLAEERGE
jgi:hypothetical protein